MILTFLKVLAAIALLVFIAWGGAAIWFDGPVSRLVAGILSGAFVVVSAGILVAVRPFGRALAVAAVLCISVLIWWRSIEPSNDRDWQPDVRRLPRAQIQGDRITLENVRDFDYRSDSDFTERWETRSFDLNELVGADMFLSYWGSPYIAHTIVSWEFSDGRYLTISIETRKEVGESYSAFRGFFRQYELYYVVTDERDVVRVRTDFRGEDVYLYRLATPPDQAREILLDYLTSINRLAERPEWYNALVENCTTTIRYHTKNIAPGNPFDWRIIVNGYIDRLGYERGTINTELPFEELRRKSDITEAAKQAGGAPDFSARIREHIPSRPKRVRVPGS